MLGDLYQDARYAVRTIARGPGFAAIVVVTIALGIGANTAVFSVVNAVLLSPVKAPKPEQIVVFGTARENLPPAGGSPTRFNAWHGLDDLFQDISAYRYSAMNMTGLATPRRLETAQVSEAYFRLFGLCVARGRTFTANEDQPGGGGFAVISDAFWRTTLSRDPDAIGKNILLGDESYEVIGVLAPGARTESSALVDVWVPFQIDPNSRDQSHFFAVAGRVREGVDHAEIEARLAVASEQFATKYPEIGGHLGGSMFVVQPIRETLGRGVRRPLMVLLGAVLLVLLIACANVANLLLVRASVRKSEMALRAGLGASRGRLVRQLLTETLLLWSAGTVLGLALGRTAIRVLLTLNPADLPRIGPDLSEVSLDWRVLTFTILVSAAAVTVFGLYPAFRGAPVDLSAAMKTGYRTGEGRLGGRSLLVAGEIMLALALVVGAGLLIRTFAAMRAVDPGFDARNVLTMQVSLADQRYRKTAGLTSLVERSVERLEAIPGVESASAGCCLPIGGGPNVSFGIVGREAGDAASPRANIPTVFPGYFAVSRIPVVEGRGFSFAEDANGPRVVVINREMARRHWPQGDAVGSQITIGAGGVERHEIVGIVGDVRYRQDGQAAPTIYTPLAQSPDSATAYNVLRPTNWMIRTHGAPTSVIGPAKAELERASGLPVIDVQLMEEVLQNSTAREDFHLALMLTFGALALLLAVVGVYGLLSYEASQRRAEIGIRLALGATRWDVCRGFLIRGVRVIAVGVVAGLALALSLADVLASFLFGVESRDPVVISVAVLVLGGATAIATFVPAFRASRMDPVAALRQE